MNQDKIETISTALKLRDLAALDDLAVPHPRDIKRDNGFRSALMLSTHNLKHLLKIESLEAECVILNLEDGVSPEDKPFALRLCAIFLAELRQCAKKLVVRVNPLEEGGEEDIDYINPFRPDAVRIPKVSCREQVEEALFLVDAEIDLHLTIETAEAWRSMSQLTFDKRVTTFYLGALDLFADLGLPQSLIQPNNPTLHYLLTHFLVTSRACGVKPVSFVYQNHRDLDGFREWLRLEKQMGFSAKGCISPKQVSALHEIFIEATVEIERAKTIVKRFEQQAAKGITGFVDEEYGFIDEPIYKGALSLLAGISD